MEDGPDLSQAEIASLFQEAADPAVAFLFDDKVRDALVAQVCDWTGCKPVWARLGLWAAQQAAAGVAASGVQWLGGRAGAGVAAVLVRCPGCDRLAAGVRRLFRRAREEAAFRAEIDAVARGERDPDRVPLPADAPDEVKLALRLMEEVQSLALYLPGEFDALHAEIAALRAESARLERIERLVAESLAALARQYEARIGDLEQQRRRDGDTIAAQNAALRALADRAERAGAAPRIEHALASAAAGNPREAEALLGEIGSRKAQERARSLEEARAAAAEAAAAYRHQGALAQSRSTEAALTAYRRAAELDPTDAWTWIFICRLEAQAGRLGAAELAAFEARRAADAAGDARDGMVASNELGDVRRAQGDLAGALAAYTEDMKITERLAASDPGNAGWQRDLIVSHWKLADPHERLPDRRHEARPHWSAALAVTRDLAASGRLAPVDAHLPAELERRLAACEMP